MVPPPFVSEQRPVCLLAYPSESSPEVTRLLLVNYVVAPVAEPLTLRQRVFNVRLVARLVHTHQARISKHDCVCRREGLRAADISGYVSVDIILRLVNG